MVSEMEKASAISRLQLGDTPLAISADLGLPTKLVEEWKENLSPTDLIKLEANTNALARVVTPTAIANTSQDNIERLRTKIEEAAIEIIDQVSLTAFCPDPIRAKSLQLLANTCSSLYTTLVNGGVAPQSGDTNISLFQQLSRD